MARVHYYEVKKMNNIDIEMKENIHEMKKRMKAMENEITVLTEAIDAQHVIIDDLSSTNDDLYTMIYKLQGGNLSGAIRELQQYLADRDGVPAGMTFGVV